MALYRAYNPNGMVQLKQTKELFLSKGKGVFWDRVNMVVVTLVHTGLLFAPFYFTWNAFWVAFILAFLTFPIGISLSYHRILEYLFAYFGLHAVQGDPMHWVSVHRYHHQFVDTEPDPHSPVEGFWFSHINWIFHNNYLREKIYTAVFMNNIVGISITLVMVYAQGLAWDFAAEVVIVMTVSISVGFIGLRCKTLRLWTSIVAIPLYFFSLLLLYVLINVFGWA